MDHATRVDGDAEYASIIAEQEAFLTSGAQPAAQTVSVNPSVKDPQIPAEQDEKTVGSGWYQQMKGVRFRLDDLEDEEIARERTASRRKTSESDRPAPSATALMGDIVERRTSNVPPILFSTQGTRVTTKGFPVPRRLGRRLRESTPASEESQHPFDQPEGEELMKEIDRENREKLAQMSEHEILELQRSLQQTLPAKLQEKLLRKKESSKTEPELSNYRPPTVPSTTEPNKPATSQPNYNLDDPSFDSHLRSFFPATTIPVSQPEWTIPVHPSEEAFYSHSDDSAPLSSSMRFDFKGKYIPPSTSRALPTHLGLHHHSLDPGAAGYTLAELAILARSTQPSQKCIALKTIGFVLADVSSGKYEWDVQEGLWDEIERERIIEILLNVVKGGREMGGNRSIQKYAEEAVGRWVDAGGPAQWDQRLKKKGYEKIDEEEI